MRTGWAETFECDLTEEEKRLCEWIAGQAQAGVRRVFYEDARDALGIVSDGELTCILRNMRERLDNLHAMVQSPIVHTQRPYFDIDPDADHIWDNYRGTGNELADVEPFGVRLHAPAMSC